MEDTVEIIKNFGFIIKKQNIKRVELVKNIKRGRLHCFVSKHHKNHDRVVINLHYDALNKYGGHFVCRSETARKEFCKIHQEILKRKRD